MADMVLIKCDIGSKAATVLCPECGRVSRQILSASYSPNRVAELIRSHTCPVCETVYRKCNASQAGNWSAAFARYNRNADAYNQSVKEDYVRKAASYTIAARTQWDEEYFYKAFGIDGEILIDHAWGIEPVTMADIKSYKSDGHSLSNGQVLPRPYQYQEARLVFHEMIEVLCSDMFSKNLVTQGCSWWVSYDYKSLEACPSYDGPLSIDFYGRLHPKHSNGTVKLPTVTNNLQIVSAPLLKSFDDKTDHRLLYRRLGVCADDVKEDNGVFQLNMFIDYEALERDRRLQGAMLEVRKKFGTNALFKGMNLLDGATTLERNQQIGGHKA